MKMRGIIFSLAVLGAVLVPAQTAAVCIPDIAFGQDANAACTTGAPNYCYVVSPGVGTTASIQGNFWNVNSYNSAFNTGVDNGTFDDSGWLKKPFTYYYIASSWGSGTTDGCPAGQTDETMVISFSDVSADNLTGYFAVACVNRGALSPLGFQFDFGGKLSSDIFLKAIPTPTITGTTKVGNEVQVTIGTPDFSGGIYTDGSTPCTTNAMVPTYDVLIRTVNRGAGDTAGRKVTDSPSWTTVATNVSSGSGTSFTTTTCGTNNRDVYVALKPNFNGPSTEEVAVSGAAIVGPSSRVVQCGPTIATPGDFKLIDKKEPVSPRRR